MQVVCNSHYMPEVDTFIAYGRPWRTYTCSCGSEMYFKVRSLPLHSRLCFSSRGGVTQYQRSVRPFQLEYAESYYRNDCDEHLYTAKLKVVTGRDQNTGEEIVENVETGRFYFKWKPM
ncbi:hypothetical protein J1N35_020289 [Gossypium stocksii]|uniref:Uncharacterized protein n=1 Tax=Gossypium stocksii TaxID=47602 RepID=A0A9D4A080_9ROSI|nr:hypothetical protein J1N35_020289 [Gossypium stocksii]